MLNSKGRYLQRVKKRKITLFVVITVFILSMACAVVVWNNKATFATGSSVSGVCGNNITWSLRNGNELFLEGNGEMYDYAKGEDVPWNEYSSRIDKVTFSGSITSIGSYSFSYLSSSEMSEITLPASIEKIGEYAFSYSSPTVILPNSLSVIGNNAFSNYANKSIYLPQDLTYIGDNAFTGSKLETVTVPENVTHIGNNAFSNADSLEEVYLTYNSDQVNLLSSSDIQPDSFGEDDKVKIVLSDDIKNIFDKKFPFLSSKTVASLEVRGLKNTYNLSSKPIKAKTNRDNENVKFVSTAPSVATIDNDGVINILSSGSFSIEAKIDGSDKSYDTAYFGPITVAKEGTCGAYLRYSLSSDNTILTIIGSGDMNDYSYSSDDQSESNPPPWEEYKDNITEIVFANDGDAINKIGTFAFAGFSKLNRVNMVDTITTIGESAFENCISLAYFKIPSMTTTIAPNTFSGCTLLKEVDIPDNVVTIGNSSFKNCSSLKTVNFLDPISVASSADKTIDESAFENCTSLITMNVPKTTKTIGVSSFKGCTSLSEITMSNVVSISKSAFEGCVSLNNVNIPKTTSTIDSFAFKDCVSMSKVNFADESVLNAINESSFENCKNLTSVAIPNSVSNIGVSSFKGCEKLSEVTLPSIISNVPESAFENCSSLTKISLPNSVTSVGKYAFKGCVSLSVVELSIQTSQLGASSFENCTSLESISLPNTILVLDDSIFKGCTSLSTVNIPNTVASIPASIFENCVSLVDISIPNNIITIEKLAFNDCTNLKQISLPRGIKTIESSAFAGCNNLDIVNLGYLESDIEGISIDNTSFTENVMFLVNDENTRSAFNTKFDGIYRAVCQMKISGLLTASAYVNISNSDLMSYVSGGQDEFGVVFTIDNTELAQINKNGDLEPYHIGDILITAYRDLGNGETVKSYNTCSVSVRINPGNITGLSKSFSDITGIANGAEKSVEGLNLPTQTDVIIGENGLASVGINWDISTFEYDPSVLTSQSFTVIGTLQETDDIKNPNNITVPINITVDAKPPEPKPAPEIDPKPEFSSVPAVVSESSVEPSTSSTASIAVSSSEVVSNYTSYAELEITGERAQVALIAVAIICVLSAVIIIVLKRKR